VARRLSVNWGVQAVLYTGQPTDEAKICFATACVQEMWLAEPGDSIVVTAGQAQRSGGTDMIRVIPI
jgi:pyruvate kinase